VLIPSNGAATAGTSAIHDSRRPGSAAVAVAVVEAALDGRIGAGGDGGARARPGNKRVNGGGGSGCCGCDDVVAVDRAGGAPGSRGGKGGALSARSAPLGTAAGAAAMGKPGKSVVGTEKRRRTAGTPRRGAPPVAEAGGTMTWVAAASTASGVAVAPAQVHARQPH